MMATGGAGYAGVALEVGSALLGIVSAFVMTRRYTPGFLITMLYVVVTPFFFLVGRGDHVRDYYARSIKTNPDVPLSAGQMVLGLNLLFWAFFLQLLALFV